jgi:hypothetical protein
MWSAVLVVSCDWRSGSGARGWSRGWSSGASSSSPAASLISSGDLTQAVDVDGTDETADLARSFSTMLVNL